MKCSYCGNHFDGDPMDMSMWEHRGVHGSFCSLSCVSSRCYVVETSKKIMDVRRVTGLPVSLNFIPISPVEKEGLSDEAVGRPLLAKKKMVKKSAKKRAELEERRENHRIAAKKWRENAKIAAKNAQDRRRNEELYCSIINPSGKTYCHHCIDNDATCQRMLNGRITPLCSKCSDAIISGIPCIVGFPLFGNEPPFPMGANKRKPMLHELDKRLGEPVSNHGFRVITQDFSSDWRD